MDQHPRTSSRTVRVGKIRQLLRLVRESYANPIAGEPRKPIPVAADELGITFIGHSSFLLQVAKNNVLVDPVFAPRLVILRRQRHAGVKVEDLPPIDVVLLSHAHMDHLNLPSLRRIIRATKKLRGHAPVVVVPNGVEDLVRHLGFSRVHTMSWWDSDIIEGLRITMTPCKHWGARMFSDTHREFGGYVIAPAEGGPSIYHSGDTAYFNGFQEVGRRLRPDVALMPIGAYFPDSYRHVHTSPEEAVQGFLDTGAQTMIPMHYGTFRLGREPMDEPLERLAAETVRLNLEGRVRVVTEGETLRIAKNTPIEAASLAMAQASNRP
jgi:L-ascorbate metabolism protein UlaG (beta-lactamase superfamily)